MHMLSKMNKEGTVNMMNKLYLPLSELQIDLLTKNVIYDSG